MYSERFITQLILQQLVDVLNVVKRIVDVESYLGNDTQLVTYLVAKLKAYCLDVCVQVFNHLVAFLRWEHAQVGLRDTQVGAHAYCAH